MLRCFPRLRRAGQRALPWAMALAALGSAPAAASAVLAAAQLELATWVGGLEAAAAGTATAFPRAEAWLAAPANGSNQELAQSLCRPRYAALAALGDSLAERQAAGDPAGAAALYHGRILPTCYEIAVCLRAAAGSGERP